MLLASPKYNERRGAMAQSLIFCGAKNSAPPCLRVLFHLAKPKKTGMRRCKNAVFGFWRSQNLRASMSLSADNLSRTRFGRQVCVHFFGFAKTNHTSQLKSISAFVSSWHSHNHKKRESAQSPTPHIVLVKTDNQSIIFTPSSLNRSTLISVRRFC